MRLKPTFIRPQLGNLTAFGVVSSRELVSPRGRRTGTKR